MPNDCFGSMTISGLTSQEQDEIINTLTNSEKEGFLSKLYPEPDFANEPYNLAGDLPFKKKSYTDKEGKDHFCSYINVKGEDGKVKEVQDLRWYEWRINNWGTKWDIYDAEVGEVNDQNLYFSFYTAWSPIAETPLRVLSNKYPKAFISYRYEELGMDFCGVYQAHNGQVVDDYNIEEGERLTPDALKNRWWSKSCPELLERATSTDNYVLQDELEDNWTDVEGDVMDDYFREREELCQAEFLATTV